MSRSAFYAARPGGWRDWWTLLHPPYTAWHLAYVVIGACLASTVNLTRLVATLLAFLCAVGFAAHALDELHGRPLGTHIPRAVLVAVTGVGLIGAVALGVVGLSRVGWALVPFLVIGPLLVVAYNLGAVWRSDPHRRRLRPCLGIVPGAGRLRSPNGAVAFSVVIAAVAAFASFGRSTSTQYSGSTHPPPVHRRRRPHHPGRRRGDPPRRANAVGAPGADPSCPFVGCRALGGILAVARLN